MYINLYTSLYFLFIRNLLSLKKDSNTKPDTEREVKMHTQCEKIEKKKALDYSIDDYKRLIFKFNKSNFYDQMILYAKIRKGQEELRSYKLKYLVCDKKLDYSEEGNIIKS